MAYLHGWLEDTNGNQIAPSTLGSDVNATCPGSTDVSTVQGAINYLYGLITEGTINPADTAPKANGTAAVGSSVKYAREDHVHPLQTTVSGNAGTATKLKTARKLKVALNSTTEITFDGSADKTEIPVSGTLPVANGGTGQTSIANIQAGKDGAGNTITTTYATKTDLSNLSKGLFQIVSTLPTTGTEGVIYAVPVSSGSSTYTKYTWENNAFVNLGTTSIDLSNYSTKANTVKSITISGKTITVTKGDDTTSTLTTQDTNTTYAAGAGLKLESNTFSITNSITAGSVGPTANATPAYGATFKVPQITYNAQGQITSATDRTVKIPASDNKVGIPVVASDGTAPSNIVNGGIFFRLSS